MPEPSSPSTAVDDLRDADDDECTFFGLVAAEAGLHGVRGGPPAPDNSVRVVRVVRVAVRGGRVVGFAQLSSGGAADTVDGVDTVDTVDLDYLHVYEHARRNGVGRALFDDARGCARRLGVTGVRILAHPAAETFFRRVGADRVGTCYPCDDVPWSRPVFRIDVAPI